MQPLKFFLGLKLQGKPVQEYIQRLAHLVTQATPTDTAFPMINNDLEPPFIVFTIGCHDIQRHVLGM